MGLRLVDTLSGRFQSVPTSPSRATTLYVCGPTVYDGAHVGHARTYLYFDVARRVLESSGVRVRHVMNVTDFEDKITDRAVSLGLSWRELARDEERRFFEDLDRLRVLRPHVRPRASAFVPGMVRLVRSLEKRGRARWEGDSLLYVPPRRPDPRNFAVGQELAQHVVSDDGDSAAEVERKGREFLLWRRQLAPSASWSSPWGHGAPGWHLECFVMADRHLGIPVDLHGGGMDLVFPHHYDENEIALTLLGERFARRYLHTAFVTEHGEKMSKSTGRLVALRPQLDRWGPDALRLYLLGPPFSERLEWSAAELRRAAERWDRIASALSGSVPIGAGGSVPISALRRADLAIVRALQDGLDIGRAFTILERLAGVVRGSGTPKFPRGCVREVRSTLAGIDRQLGLGLFARSGSGTATRPGRSAG